MAAAARPSTALHVRAPPTLTRCAPASTRSAKVRAGPEGEHVDRLRQRAAHGTDLVERRQAGRVEHVRAGGLEGLEPGDRVVEVGLAPDVVLGARGERERERQRAHRLDRGGHALGRVLQIVEPAGGIPVLDRAADRADFGNTADRLRCRLGLGAVAVLQVGRDGEIGRRRQRRDVRGDLVERRAPVRPRQREREAGARRRERLEAERLEHARRARVPRVRDHERLARVERPKRLGLLSRRRHAARPCQFCPAPRRA